MAFVQLHSYIVVMMQGFAQHLSVALPLQPYRTLTSVDPSSPASVDLDLTLISRRSTERPGLRYQRRGIDSSGSVANFVETEFIVECVREGTRHVDSFVQVRGSIPLYWSQSPWALKPPPVLERTEEESRKAMRKHLEGLKAKYGRLVLVNLAETTGKEETVVNAYGEGVKSLGVDEEEMRCVLLPAFPPAGFHRSSRFCVRSYVSFDFHKETKGFNYARISNLIEDIKHDLEEMQTFWTTPEDVYSMQKGACRVNCIDSLDVRSLPLAFRRFRRSRGPFLRSALTSSSPPLPAGSSISTSSTSVLPPARKKACTMTWTLRSMRSGRTTETPSRASMPARVRSRATSRGRESGIGEGR